MNTLPLRTTTAAAVLACCGLALVAPAQASRDPMRPPQAAAVRAAARVEPAFQLTAVIGSDERRVAIVNGRVVRAGDTVDGALILAVFDGGIRYSRAGAARELRLAASPVRAAMKRPAGAVAAGPGSDR